MRVPIAIATAALALGAGLLAAPADSVARDGPTFRLKRVDVVGDVYRVETLSVTEGEVVQRVPGRAVVGDRQVKRDEAVYDEEVVKAAEDGTVVLRRRYELATSLRKNVNSKATEPIKTALHGRDVHVTRAPSGAIIRLEVVGLGPAKADPRRLAAEEIAYGCLPPDPVAVGDRWEVEPARLGRVLFGEGYAAALVKIEARGRLAGMKRHAGVECARVKLEVKVHSEPTEAATGLLLDLEGELLFSPALGHVLELELAGRTGYVQQQADPDSGAIATIEATGRARLVYRASPS